MILFLLTFFVRNWIIQTCYVRKKKEPGVAALAFNPAPGDRGRFEDSLDYIANSRTAKTDKKKSVGVWVMVQKEYSGLFVWVN